MCPWGLSTLRMTLFFDTPKARTISTWRHTPWQISWAVNIRNERWSFQARKFSTLSVVIGD